MADDDQVTATPPPPVTAAQVVADILASFTDPSAVDRAAIEAFAAQAARAREARRRIDSEGLIVEDGKGFPVPHPALELERAASRELRGWETARPDLFAGGAKPAGTSSTSKGGAADDRDADTTIADELAAARAARQAGT
ncbi:terminase small subunit [Gordonia phage Nadeem]|uniref:Terminase small subunit n=1 Tax=Gordonia phage Nadeem TaxID=2250369 RepID=A0A2Z5HDS0_9CAUD|nr:terminase small subunit [Gordonia phage Nadeem]